MTSKIRDLVFSDLVLYPSRGSLRVEGALVRLRDEFLNEAKELFSLCKKQSESINVPDFRVVYGEQAYRCVDVDEFGGCFVLRKISNNVMSWKQLRLPHKMVETTLKTPDGEFTRGGLILVVGETNSGKSSTINALIHEMAVHNSWMFMAFEDPIEQEFDLSKYQSGAEIIQREVHSTDLTNALKIALRANADVIKVGEIRDRQAAEVALDAALSGHSVLATIHGNTMEEGLARFSNRLSDEYADLFSIAFRCCIFQKLQVNRGTVNRVLELQYLAKTQTVVNTLRDKNFNGLSQTISQHTKKYVEGMSTNA